MLNMQGQPEGGAGVQQFEFISPTGGAWQMHDSPASSASWDTPFDGVSLTDVRLPVDCRLRFRSWHVCFTLSPLHSPESQTRLLQCCMAPAYYVAPSPSPSPSPSVSPSVSRSASATPNYAPNSCAPGFTMNAAANRCYAVVGVGLGGITWTDAQARCRALGSGFASLAAMRNAAEMAAVVTGRCNGLVPANGLNGVELFWWLAGNDGE